MERIGVAIIAFQRPALLRQLLQSLERQTCLENASFHQFQEGAVSVFDGQPRAPESVIRDSVQVFLQSSLPRKQLHTRPTQVGTAIHQYGAVSWMVKQYERVLILEEDVIVSPHYLRLAGILFEQIRDRSDIYGFSLGFRKMCLAEHAQDHLAEMRYGTPHWWDIGFWASSWAKILPHFLEYYALVRGVDYRNRPSDAIRTLYEAKGWHQQATSQDGGKDMAVHAAGMKRIVAVVNRGVSTGAKGEHFRPAEFHRMGLDEQKPYVFTEDATLERFVLPEVT